MAPAVHAWFLERVVDCYLGIHKIYPDVADVQLNVEPIPGLSPNDYLECIAELSRSGEIEVLDRSEPNGAVTGTVAINQLRSNPQSAKRYSYRLTPLGGATWERLAQPNWKRFIGERWDPQQADIRCVSRDRLFAFLGWLSDLRPAVLKVESVNIVRHSFAEVTYWKELPNVWVAVFEYVASESYRPTAEWIRDWSQSLYKWHRLCMELPGWPMNT